MRYNASTSNTDNTDVATQSVSSRSSRSSLKLSVTGAAATAGAKAETAQARATLSKKEMQIRLEKARLKATLCLRTEIRGKSSS